MRRIWIIAQVTFREAARKKLLLVAVLAGLGFLALFATGLHYQVQAFDHRHASPFVRKQVGSVFLMLGLYAINMLMVLMTVLISVDTLSGEIASGTIQAIATKPISRWELVLGKWLGFSGMLAAYILLMVGGTNAVSYAMTGGIARHWIEGFALMVLEAVLLLSITLFFGSSLSTLTSGALALGLHGLAFVGGGVEQAGALTDTPKAVLVGVLASVVMPSESLWRRAAYVMQSPLATAVNATPFSAASVPSGWMVAYAGFYALCFLVLAVWRIERRDL